LTSQSLLIFANNWGCYDILLSRMIVKGQSVKLGETIMTTTLDSNRYFQRSAEKCDRQTRKDF